MAKNTGTAARARPGAKPAAPLPGADVAVGVEVAVDSVSEAAASEAVPVAVPVAVSVDAPEAVAVKVPPVMPGLVAFSY